MANNKLMIAKKNKMIKLKGAIEKLQRSLQLGKKDNDIHEEEEERCVDDDSTWVPEDVKEGHFAVVAVDNDDNYDLAVKRRFVVPLRYLNHPVFRALLERAAEEYGFEHGGALTIPCRPSEIERILAEERREEGERKGGRVNHNGRCRLSSPNLMLQSCSLVP